MAKKFVGTIKEAAIVYAPFTQMLLNDYLRNPENDGKKMETTPKRGPVSPDLRGFYFGAVIPVVRGTCNEWTDLDAYELHEVIKKMLFYFETYNPLTKRTERFGRSVMADSDWNNTAKAMNFLDIVREYLTGCGEEMPSSEEYNKAMDEAVLINKK